MNEIYNEEIKERFLSQYENEQTQKTIRNLFFNTYIIENTLEKDLFEQNLTEIGKCIENSNPHTRNVAASNGRFISQYISWAVENGYRKSNINPLKGVTADFYDKFIDKTRKIHYSYDEFLTLLEEMQNGQDQAFLFLIWEGIMGEKFSQLQQLTFDDVDWDNKTVYVKERDEKIDVSEDCIKYLDKAYKQNTYYQYNKNTKEFVEKELLSSSYIFKNIRSPRASDGQMVGMSVFYNRLHAMKDYLELEYLTPMAIKQSGMIYEAVKQYQEFNVLAYDQLAELGRKYAFSQITNNGYTYYNTFLMREFVNESNISDLYGINLEIKLR